ncbi:MAG: hypothetical protein FWD76_00080 [Firmicutes bacterium]|nr:hypothetical protein [Bacillota bacterium]
MKKSVSDKKTKFWRVATIAFAMFFAVAFFAGCNLVQKDALRDDSLIVATVQIGEQKQQDGGDKVFAKQTFHIYKQDLKNQLSSQAQSGTTIDEAAANAAIDVLVQGELVQLDFAKQLYFGDLVLAPSIDMTPNDLEDDHFETDYRVFNAILKATYTNIDKRLFEIANEILAERGQPAIGKPDSGSNRPEFPVAPNEDVPLRPTDPGYVPEALYVPDVFPGNSGDGTDASNDGNNYASLQREAFRRYIKELTTGIPDIFRASKDIQKGYQKQMEDITAILKGADQKEAYRQGYLKLGNDLVDFIQKGGNYLEKGEQSILWYSVARSSYRAQLLSLFRDRIEWSARDNISNERINKYYNDTLDNQKRQFADDADGGAFATAADGTGLLLYNPGNRLYWVKHVLVEFSEAQKAELANIKAMAQSQEEYVRLRASLAGVDESRGVYGINIKTHPIVDGNEDASIQLTAADVYNEIKHRVGTSGFDAQTGNGYDSHRTFDSMIFKYNRDKGFADKIKDEGRGYLVKPASVPNNPEKDGLDGQWMVEFSKAARALRYQYNGDAQLGGDPMLQNRLGTMEPALTDYGLHIVYLSDVTVSNRVLGLGDYTTASHRRKVYDAIKDTLANQDAGKAYEIWQAQAVGDYLNQNSEAVTRFPKRYKDLWQ